MKESSRPLLTTLISISFFISVLGIFIIAVYINIPPRGDVLWNGETRTQWNNETECCIWHPILNTTVADLRKDYNMTCQQIDYLIKNWVPSSNPQEAINNVGTLRLQKDITTRKCCDGRDSGGETTIYLKQDYLEYYLKNCLNNESVS